MNQKYAVAVFLAVCLIFAAQAGPTLSIVSAQPQCRIFDANTNFTLAPETFRFLRTEQQGFPPVVHDGAIIVPATTNTFGIFAFRYHRADAMTFWGFGEPQNGRFQPKFTSYRVSQQENWHDLAIGYCGNGAVSYTLQPDTDYELKIPLTFDSVAGADQVRVSLNSLDGMFWSEPFQISAR